MYFELLPFAKEHGVKIATENMYDWDSSLNHSVFAACATCEGYLEMLKAVDDEDFVACLDIGHAEMEGSGDGAANMVRALGSKLQALHIHDNDCLHDNHQLPFTMNIDFAPIVQALKDMGFTLTESATNFLFAAPNVISGKEYYEKLKDRGVLVRYFGTQRLSPYVRITIGTEEEMNALLSHTREILKEANP